MRPLRFSKRPALLLAASLTLQLVVSAGVSFIVAPSDQHGSLPFMAAAEASGMEERVENLLRQTAKLLQSTAQFTFAAEETRDVVSSTGIMLSISHSIDITVQRPNKFRHDVAGDVAQRKFWYDGSKVTFVDMTNGIYATREAPATLDAALDLVTTSYNVDLPLSSIVYSQPYDVWTREVQAGFYAGLHQVGGVACHHLVFVQDGVDWQLWIEDSDTPLPCKLAIAFRNHEGIPRYTAVFKQWDLKPQWSGNPFTAAVPADVQQVEFQSVAK